VPIALGKPLVSDQATDRLVPRRFPLCLILSVLACLLLLSIEVAAGKLQETEQHLKKFFAVQSSADQFAKELELDGKSAQEALTALSGRGFKCDIKLVRFGKLVKSGKVMNTIEQYVSEEETKPLIECVKAPSDIQDCLQLEVSVSVRWRDPQQPIEVLLREASSSPIHVVGATCKIR
jgi:hypothetical protein